MSKQKPHDPKENWRVTLIKRNIATANKLRGLDLKTRQWLDELNYVDLAKMSGDDFNTLQRIVGNV